MWHEKSGGHVVAKVTDLLAGRRQANICVCLCRCMRVCSFAIIAKAELIEIIRITIQWGGWVEFTKVPRFQLLKFVFKLNKV